MDYIQRKSLRHRFWRLNLSELDLFRIGVAIREKCAGEDFGIEVRSSDEQDLFRSSEPNFFTSDAMPEDISVVRITGARKENALTCELELRTGVARLAELTVSGRDVTTVSGLFHELVRELEKKQSMGSWIAKHIDSFLVYLVLGFIAAIGVYSLFDLPLDIAIAVIPEFQSSILHKTILAIGWACVAIALSSGGSILHDRVKKLFTAVQFSGRLRDHSTKQRRTIVTIFALILLPIILSVLANFLTDLIKIWSAG